MYVPFIYAWNWLLGSLPNCKDNSIVKPVVGSGLNLLMVWTVKLVVQTVRTYVIFHQKSDCVTLQHFQYILSSYFSSNQWLWVLKREIRNKKIFMFVYYLLLLFEYNSKYWILCCTWHKYIYFFLFAVLR